MIKHDFSNDSEGLVIFRIKLRPDANTDELTRLSKQMAQIGASPDIKYSGSDTFTSEDNSILMIHHFPSLNAIERFVHHPEHQAVMQRGSEFFDWVEVTICTVKKEGRITFNEN